MNKKKLLIVSAISPFPKTSGGAVRIYNTIKYLSQKFDLYFIFFIPTGVILNNSELSFLKKYTTFFTYIYQKPSKNFSTFFNELQPYWFSDWLDDELKILLPKIIKKYDIKLIQIECTQLLYLKKFIPKKVKTIFVAYDVSTISFWRRLLELKITRYSLLYFIFWLQILIYEKYYLKKFYIVISMSSYDREILENKFKLKNVIVIPNGIEKINFLNKKNNKIINLGYIGSFNHSPNQAAVKYFLYEIAPLLRKNQVKFNYFIAGDNKPEEIISLTKSLKNHNIVNLGKVKAVEDFYEKIDILVAPIFSGSGTRIKILESLSFGIPVISTSIGAEGIDIDNKNLFITNNKMGFVDAIKSIQKNPENTKFDLDNLKNEMELRLWNNVFDNYPEI